VRQQISPRVRLRGRSQRFCDCRVLLKEIGDRRPHLVEPFAIFRNHGAEEAAGSVAHDVLCVQLIVNDRAVRKELRVHGHDVLAVRRPEFLLLPRLELRADHPEIPGARVRLGPVDCRNEKEVPMLGSSLHRSGHRAGLRVNFIERLEDVRERLRLEPAAVRRAGIGVDAVFIGAVAEERAVGHESI